VQKSYPEIDGFFKTSKYYLKLQMDSVHQETKNVFPKAEET